MALTKVTDRLIAYQRRNVKDYGAVGDGVADDTAAIQSAFGGSGSTPDNIHVYFPNGTYKISGTGIQVYRSGETLRNVKIEGESSDGVLIQGNGKGLVIGEPDASDGLWGNAGAINTVGVEVRNLGHQCNDIGLWFVYCRDVIVDNIKGYDLVCVAVGNDLVDDCEDVRISNVTRMNDGRDLSPDAWYSIGLYRVTRFSITNYQSKFLSAAAGTGGNHIIVASSSIGVISGCTIFQSQTSGTGINLETETKTTVVTGNTIVGCSNGITSFSSTNAHNTISNNIIFLCNYGLNVQSKNDIYANNQVGLSYNNDIYSNNTDAQPNTFIGNVADSYNFPSSIERYQKFINNVGGKTRMFVPAINFKLDNASADFDGNLHLINSGGAITAYAHLDTGGRTGNIRNVRLLYNRTTPTTDINCKLYTLITGGILSEVATVTENGANGYKETTPVFASGSSVDTNSFTQVIASYNPTAANLSDLIGVTFDFTEFGSDQFVST